MKNLLLVVLILSTSQSFVSAQCTETDAQKILLVGDSWAFFMGVDQTINDVMENWGHSNVTFFTNPTLAENGAETDDFLTPAKQQEIQNQLLSKPEIEVVHLSIGGNDVLGDWHVSFTQQQTDSLENAVFQRLDSVITFIKSVRPDVHVLWSGYAYPNFEEVIQSAAPFQTTHPFYGTWEDMGFPNFLQLNTILNEFSTKIEAFYATDPRVSFVPATGVMQYQFGQTTPLGTAPGGTYAPFSVPLPIGNPNYPSPRTTMRDYGITRDCFHLSAAGYRALISYHAQKFYHKFLMDDLVTLSIDSETGSVSSTGSISDFPKIGNTGSEDFAAHLSFDVDLEATATVETASLFLHVTEVVGTNVLNGGISIALKNGNFGASATVESSDFDEIGDFVGVPCAFGSKSTGNWVRFDLPQSVAQEIASGQNQFLIKADGATSGNVVFSDAQDADFAPVLNLGLSGSTNSLTENYSEKLNIHPNPTTGIVHLSVSESPIVRVKIADLTGRLQDLEMYSSASVDVSNFPAGVYILFVETEAGILNERIIKR